ncbi:MAG: transcriptional repressor NrdR [Chloroflexi bacterium]|nr:transcriptional repressor NrdR [Chloroflexota bacterium]
MRCPFCGHEKSRVVDSREGDDSIRRRRLCLKCNARFTTYERQQRRSLFVIKKDGRREEFNRDKLASGIRKACEKRPLPTGTVDKLADAIEADLYSKGKAEVPSHTIGEMVSERLKHLDQVAYIRFASVYREFTDLTALKRAVDNLADQSRSIRVSANQLPLIPDEENQLVQRRGSRGKKPASAKEGK